jgi:t-SNARE complex subunit (syntaxin)
MEKADDDVKDAAIELDTAKTYQGSRKSTVLMCTAIIIIAVIVIALIVWFTR